VFTGYSPLEKSIFLTSKLCIEEPNKKTHPRPGGPLGGPNYEKQTKQALQI